MASFLDVIFFFVYLQDSNAASYKFHHYLKYKLSYCPISFKIMRLLTLIMSNYDISFGNITFSFQQRAILAQGQTWYEYIFMGSV